jgi:hypothetical protein
MSCEFLIQRFCLPVRLQLAYSAICRPLLSKVACNTNHCSDFGFSRLQFFFLCCHHFPSWSAVSVYLGYWLIFNQLVAYLSGVLFCFVLASTRGQLSSQESGNIRHACVCDSLTYKCLVFCQFKSAHTCSFNLCRPSQASCVVL